MSFDTENRKNAQTRAREGSCKAALRDVTEQQRIERKMRRHEERERRRLAVGGHNRIGRTLAVVRERLAALRQSESLAEVSQRLGPLEELLGQAIEAAQALPLEMSSPTFHEPGREAALDSELTTREREVLRLIAEGLTNKDIAAKLRVSVKTVSTHRQHVMDKLDIHNAVGLVKYAIRQGMTSPGRAAPGSGGSRGFR